MALGGREILDRRGEGQDAENADQGDGGDLEDFGDEVIEAVLLNGNTEVGHGILLCEIKSWETCIASYHVTQGTLQYIFAAFQELFVAPRYSPRSIANQ